MTKIKIFATFFFIVFITMAINSNTVYAQDKAIDRREKALAKKKAQQQKKAQKGVEKQKARHLKIQTKDTRKRMKANEKKSRQYSDGKKEFYFARFFKKRKR